MKQNTQTGKSSIKLNRVKPKQEATPESAQPLRDEGDADEAEEVETADEESAEETPKQAESANPVAETLIARIANPVKMSQPVTQRIQMVRNIRPPTVGKIDLKSALGGLEMMNAGDQFLVPINVADHLIGIGCAVRVQ